jgi:hypothetical protein
MKRLIITEEEKKHILSLHQNLNIKGILQEGIAVNDYTTMNDQKIYYGTNTNFDYVDIKKGTKFTRSQGGATAFGGKLVFSCKSVGKIFKTGNKHFTYNNKTYWAKTDFQNTLIKSFCSSNYSNIKSCKGNCENGYGTMTTNNGGVYVGYFKNGEPDGYGTSTYKDGSKYEGNWKNGKYNGKGFIKYKNGNEFSGYFKEDKYDGQGRYSFNDGAIFWGVFSMGNITDQTYYKNIKGCFFKGKGGRKGGYWALSGRDGKDMDEIPCTPDQWIDLEKQGGNNNSGSNQGGNNNSGSNQGGNNNSGSNQGGNNNSGSNQGGQKLCSKWNNCTNKSGSTTNYVRCDWCSEIGRLQGCLRDENGNPLKADKAWGKSTEAALNKLGYNGTDGVSSENITKICDDLLANQTTFNPGDFGDGSDENFPPPQPI